MLVLGRRPGQKLILGDDIEIVVLEVRGEHVRLGITAPRNVSVLRQEMLERIAAENLEATMAVTAGIPSMIEKTYPL